MGAKYRNEEQLRSVLAQRGMEIEPSDELFKRIKKDINEWECKREMGKIHFGFNRGKRSVAILTCCILLLSATAVIGGSLGKQWISHSNNNQYLTLPTEQQVLEDVGFSPKYVAELPGGFSFDRAGIGEGELQDEDGNVLTKTKDITFSYIRERDKKELALMVEQVREEFISSDTKNIIGTVNGLELNYYEQNYKFVPPDYELTKEDQLAMEQGKLEVSYGTTEISEEKVQGISWYEDGLSYMIMGNDCNFSEQDMIAMAEAVIKQ